MDKPRILMIYTGGTIGMELNPESNSLEPLAFERLLTYVPELDKLNCKIDHMAFDEPVDSSDADPVFWNRVAVAIEGSYSTYDGFVVLHGTDTMAYTASALSFMLKHLNKPVVITGSQLPMGSFRTDGRENLISAIEIASLRKNDKPILREVAIYFEYSLYRGNRSHKFSTEHFDAIISPNYPALAEAGVHINWDYSALQRKTEERPLQLYLNWSTEVTVIKMFPGISASQIAYQFKQPEIKVYILETFGSGNISMKSDILRVIKDAVDTDNIVINVSQCRKGKVDQRSYASGVKLSRMGVLSAKDMTIESTITKCMHLLANTDSITEFAEYFSKNLSGELSE